MSASGPAGPVLDGGQRAQVLDALLTVLGQVYAHLPAKRAAYARDPVQALTLLRRSSDDMSDGDFHLAVTGIVTGLRDAHTRYVGPASPGPVTPTSSRCPSSSSSTAPTSGRTSW